MGAPGSPAGGARDDGAGHLCPTQASQNTPSTRRRQPRRLKPGVKRISLALQGGGSHGAFTWGVMHRLMSDPHIYIDGISGTSAGAMNAVVFADGFLKGRRQGAIDALERVLDPRRQSARHAARRICRVGAIAGRSTMIRPS